MARLQLPLPPPGRGGGFPWRRGGYRRYRAALLSDETGAATAEYAIATMAAVGFAGLLVVVLRSDEVRTLLTELVRHALAIP